MGPLAHVHCSVPGDRSWYGAGGRRNAGLRPAFLPEQAGGLRYIAVNDQVVATETVLVDQTLRETNDLGVTFETKHVPRGNSECEPQAKLQLAHLARGGDLAEGRRSER